MAEDTVKTAIEEYIAALPEPRRDRARSLHNLIVRLYPHAKVTLRQKMPTYTIGPNTIAWGNQKAHLSVYTSAADRLAAFRARYPRVPASEGCLNFRDRDPFPLEALEGVVHAALAPASAKVPRRP